MRVKRRANTTWVVSEKYPPPTERPGVVNHFGISGGKDSSAMGIWAVHESGYPRESMDFSFCDTGNEAPVTYDYLSYLEDALQIGITRIKPELDFFELAKKKKRFPSAKARFCTEHLKIIPTTQYIEHLTKSCKELVLHSGVRALESNARAELPPESFDSRFGCWVKRPLLKWTIQQVWEIHHKYGIKPNPLYAMGMARVGCFPCMMSRKSEVRKVVRYFPKVIDKIREREHQTGAGAAADGSPFKGSTFFRSDTVPKSHRTGRWIRKSDGKEFLVATIDDVARWSRTARGGENFDFDFDEIASLEKLPMGEHARSCPSSMGMCE